MASIGWAPQGRTLTWNVFVCRDTRTHIAQMTLIHQLVLLPFLARRSFQFRRSISKALCRTIFVFFSLSHFIATTRVGRFSENDFNEKVQINFEDVFLCEHCSLFCNEVFYYIPILLQTPDKTAPCYSSFSEISLFFRSRNFWFRVFFYSLFVLRDGGFINMKNCLSVQFLSTFYDCLANCNFPVMIKGLKVLCVCS